MTQEGSRLSIHPESRQLQTTSFVLPELSEDEIRIQVLYSGISRNDVLYLQGQNSHDYFGVAVVGRVVAIGKSVGTRKNGEIVGIYYENVNRGQYSTGFSTYLQVHVSRAVYIPDSIDPQRATELLGDGVVAFNSLQRIPKGSSIAVIGTGHLAYLTVQFAKKVFGFTVTVLSLAGTEGVQQKFGCDAVDTLTLQTIKKSSQKFDALIATEPLGAPQAKVLQSIVIRTGKVIFSVQFGYSPAIVFFELIVCQREFIGAKRGDHAQYVKTLRAAAFSDIKGTIIQAHPASEYKNAFQRAKSTNYANQIVLKY